MSDLKSEKDQDRGKGAVEQDRPSQTGNTSMDGQIGHRDQDPCSNPRIVTSPKPGLSPDTCEENE